ncbi:MAG: NAD(P)-dependent oxidoreductase [Ruminococcus sp.]|jgi:UDP-glucose 4-epimerase|nr:NAD(P)-dependent oxidoreductase [Ruminococcus sp.]
MQRVLVTGGSGLIGRYICSGLLKKGFAVVAVDKNEDLYNDGKLNFTFEPCDINDKNAVTALFDKYKFDIMIHAAFTVDNDLGPVVTEKEIDASKQCDKYLYRYAMAEGVGKIILISTDQVYDFPKTREPIREDSDIKIKTNYATMKYAQEKALVSEMLHFKEVICCITRVAPVYTLNYTDNLLAKITDPKDNTKFVSGKGQYGFQLCCVHNLVDFILCFAKNAEDLKYAGIYNVSDKLLITAADIITFMREHHHLGTVVQRSPGGAMNKIKGFFGGNKDEKTHYRYLDLNKLENNNMLDTTKAAKLVTFRWDIHNTK